MARARLRLSDDAIRLLLGGTEIELSFRPAPEAEPQDPAGDAGETDPKQSAAPEGDTEESAAPEGDTGEADRDI